MDPKKRYDNSGEAFEADIQELFNIPPKEDQPPEPEPPEPKEAK